MVSRSDFSVSEDDNTIASDQNALGYFGYSYYPENTKKLKHLCIDSGKGAVLASEKTIINGTYHLLSMPIFIYVGKKGDG